MITRRSSGIRRRFVLCKDGSRRRDLRRRDRIAEQPVCADGRFRGYVEGARLESHGEADRRSGENKPPRGKAGEGTIFSFSIEEALAE